MFFVVLQLFHVYFFPSHPITMIQESTANKSKKANKRTAYTAGNLLLVDIKPLGSLDENYDVGMLRKNMRR